jgi:NADH-quinone oxidoreductase subunit A
MTPLAAYLLLFLAVGIGFIFVHLVAGKLIRPRKPNPEKGTIYECGEPTIGSAWVQFDLRFYVVALLFVIFDVEVAFFFPWAEVFGKANAVATAKKPETAEEYVAYAEKVLDAAPPRNSTSVLAADTARYEKITGRRADGTVVRDKEGVPIGKLSERADEHPDSLPALLKQQEALRAKHKAGGKLTADEAIKLQYEGPLRSREFETNRQAASNLAWLALGEVLVFFGVLLVGFAYLWRRGDLEWVRSTAAERLEARGVPPVVPPAPTPAPTRETVAS